MKKYEILEKLGQGGMGVVYKAFQKNLNREVAIKVLPKAYSENDEVKRRFLSEMKICGGLVHPNIIRVFDDGEQDGTLYYVMEYIQGTTLQELVQQKGALAVDQALKITGDVLEAMKYYHPQGLIHRDIKPANIMVKASTNEAILMDFGLVKALYASGITIQGRLVGTPRYMSPEMLRGVLVDGRSDIFQLGLVFYEMCAGTPAFKGKDRAEVTRKLLEEEPERPGQINPLLDISIENLIANAIDKNIDNRYQSAEEFLHDVHAAREGAKILRRGAARAIKAPSTSRLAKAVGDSIPTTETPSVPAAVSTPLTVQLPQWLPLALKAGAGAMALLVVAWLAFRPGRMAYTARDVRIEAGFDEATVRWLSDVPYPNVLEYGEKETSLQRWTPGPDEPSDTRHVARLDDLSEGTEYVLRVLFPGGGKSQLHHFRTPSLYFTSSAVKRTGLRAIQVNAQTSAEVLSRLEFRRGSEEGKLDGSGQPSKEHRFALEDLPLDRPASVRVVAVSRTGTEKGGDWLDVPAPVSLAASIAQAGRRFPVKDWVTKAERVLASRLGPRPAGQQLDEMWKQEPLSRLLRPFGEIAGDFLSSDAVALQAKIDLYEGLSNLADLNHYCAERRIPFEVPVDGCLPSAFSASSRPRVQSSEIYKKDILSRFGFTPVGVRPALRPPGSEAPKAPGEEPVLVKLERAKEVRQAELLLAFEPKDPLAIFHVRINDKLTLRLRPEPQQHKPIAAVYHTFDPRVLHDGENRFDIRAGTVAGHKMSEASKARILALVVGRKQGR